MMTLEALQTLTAITDPAANIAIIGGVIWLIKHHVEIKTHHIRITNIEREVFK